MTWHKNKYGNQESDNGRWQILTLPAPKYYGSRKYELRDKGKTIFSGHWGLAKVKAIAEKSEVQS